MCQYEQQNRTYCNLFPVEILADLLEDDDLYNLVREWERTERGSLPSYTEALIILWQVRTQEHEREIFIELAFRCVCCGETSRWSINR